SSWTGRNPIEVLLQHRPTLELDTAAIRPAQHREQVGIGNRKSFTQQELVCFEAFGDKVQLVRVRLANGSLRFVWRAGKERATKALVQLGRDVVQPFLKLVSLH